MEYQVNVPYVGQNGNWWVNGVDSETKAQGEPGKDGITPHIGEDGYWYIGAKKTPVRARGYDGVTPHISEDGYWCFDQIQTEVKAFGEAGRDGVSPYIGTDGFWYVGEMNTGVKALGEKGADGEPGIKGEKGDSGEVDIISVLDKVYPVGSIYMNVQNINPGNFFGGTWKIWGPGRVPVCVDNSIEFGTVEKQEGSKTHTLNVNEMPVHTHTQNAHSHSANGWTFSVYKGTRETETVGDIAGSGWKMTQVGESGSWGGYTATQAVTATNKNAGLSKPHNNLQPYITCYMWKRIA